MAEPGPTLGGPPPARSRLNLESVEELWTHIADVEWSLKGELEEEQQERVALSSQPGANDPRHAAGLRAARDALLEAEKGVRRATAILVQEFGGSSVRSSVRSGHLEKRETLAFAHAVSAELMEATPRTEVPPSDSNQDVFQPVEVAAQATTASSQPARVLRLMTTPPAALEAPSAVIGRQQPPRRRADVDVEQGWGGALPQPPSVDCDGGSTRVHSYETGGWRRVNSNVPAALYCSTSARSFGSLESREKRKVMEEKVWAEFEKEHSPNFFQDVRMAKDGGLSEVLELWHELRWFSATVLVLSILSNLAILLTNDLNVILGSFQWKCASEADPYLLSRVPVEGGYNALARATRLPEVSDAFAPALICIIELLGLLLLLSHGAYQSLKAVLSQDDHSHARWFATVNVFWKTLPALSSYSAMKLLHFLIPTVLAGDAYRRFEASQAAWPGLDLRASVRLARMWSAFVVTRLLCLVVGLDALLIKLRMAFAYADQAHVSSWNVLNIVMLVVQMLGIVHLGSFVGGQLFTFIFGGVDTTRQVQEHAKKSVWRAMLVRRIWLTFPWVQSLVMMLSIDDADLQRLVHSERRMGSGAPPVAALRELDGAEEEDFSEEDNSVPDGETSDSESSADEQPGAWGLWGMLTLWR